MRVVENCQYHAYHVITLLLEDNYINIKKYKKNGTGSALSPSLLWREPKKGFVSPSINMMKLGKTW